MTYVPSIPYSLSIVGGPELHPPPSDVDGFPTVEDVHSYPVMFTWDDLKDIIRTSDLGRLRRPPGLQKRYLAWADEVKDRYGNGSTEKYILSKRIKFDSPSPPVENGHGPVESRCFARDTEAGQYCLAANDWPYSAPRDVCHVLVWSQLPFIPPAQLTPEVDHHGVSGFSGMADEEDEHLDAKQGDVAWEIREFVKDRWSEDEWETAWFLNPPRLQSVKLLPHFHVFARLKSQSEKAQPSK